MTDKIFGDGIFFKRPRDGAPEFVKGHVSLKVADLGIFMNKHEKDGYVNLDLKESKGGKLYFELNTWKKEVTPISALTPTDEKRIQDLRNAANNTHSSEIYPNPIPF